MVRIKDFIQTGIAAQLTLPQENCTTKYPEIKTFFRLRSPLNKTVAMGIEKPSIRTYSSPLANVELCVNCLLTIQNESY